MRVALSMQCRVLQCRGMFFALGIIVFILLITFVYAGVRAAPWVPMRADDVRRALQLADIREGDVVYDLGCGDGRFICAAAERGARAVGFEISLLPFLLAHIRRLRSPVKKRIHIRYRDFWNTSFSDATVVFFFLMPKIYGKLAQKLKKELQPGARVVAYTWPMKEWTPLEIVKADHRPALYLYIFETERLAD